MPKNNLQGTLDLLILQAMYAIPGVKNDGTVDALPFSGENHGGFISAGVPGLSGWDNRSVAEIDVIGGDYLQTMRVHLMTGRWFRQDETHNSSKIAIVNDVVARRLWPRRSAIGQQICVGCTQENPSDWRQVVGVVSMFRHAALDGPPPQNVYLSAGAFENTVFVVVKTNRPMGEMGSAIRRAIAGVNPAESYEVRYNDQNQMLFVSCPDRGRITAGEVPNAGLYSLCPTSSVTTDLDKGTLRGYTEKHGGPGYPQFLSFSQSFAYDPVNRLQTASDSDGWSRSFSYDQYGNQWLSGASGINPSAWNRQSASDIDPAKNQVWYAQYDRAGNQTRIASALWLSYDAENRQIQSYDSQWHTLANQYYDGLGQRVAKILPDGSTRLYVYDAFGRLAEKYSSAAQSALCATCYLSYDHLALVRLSPAMITCPSAKRSGVGRRIVIATLGPGVGWRRASPGRSGMGETTPNLDYFQARYYSGEQGRFLSPDPANAGADLYNPQTWNAYSYVVNNPLIYTDPSGENLQSLAGDFFGGLGNLASRIGSSISGWFGGGSTGPDPERPTIWSEQPPTDSGPVYPFM